MDVFANISELMSLLAMTVAEDINQIPMKLLTEFDGQFNNEKLADKEIFTVGDTKPIVPSGIPKAATGDPAQNKLVQQMAQKLVQAEK